MERQKVLVLGDDTRSCLTIVRSLGRRGLAVHVAPTDFRSPALRSRYIEAVVQLPAPVNDGADWTRAFEKVLRRDEFDLVIPCTDRSLLPLHAHRENFAGLTRLAIPDPEHVDILFDKSNTRKLAESLGVNLSPAIDPRETDDPAEILARLGAPVVVKPNRSVRAEALDRQELVQIAGTPQQLQAAMAGRLPGSYYIEAFFAGTGVGVSVLADQGSILQAFQHHRIHQAARGGSSAYRVSARLSPELLAACESIVGRLGYTGVAMFEFRRNFQTNAWVLLEVNARPWGSMPLAAAAGVDFPYAWYRLLVDRVQLEQRPYRQGIYGRNLDLDIAFARKRAAELKGFSRASFAAQWVAGFTRAAIGRERLDTLVLDDAAPALRELQALAMQIGRFCCMRLPGYRTARRMVTRARLRRSIRKTTAAGRNPTVAFICYGNICRSAFAERALSSTLGDWASDILVSSAGTYQVSGRDSPEEARLAALRCHVDLSTHRSRHVTMQLLSAASIVIAFDRSNIEALKAQYPRIPCPVILLGELIDTLDANGEIADPYGGGPAVFDAAFAAIERGVAMVRRCLAESVVASSPT